MESLDTKQKIIVGVSLAFLLGLLIGISVNASKLNNLDKRVIYIEGEVSS